MRKKQSSTTRELPLRGPQSPQHTSRRIPKLQIQFFTRVPKTPTIFTCTVVRRKITIKPLTCACRIGSINSAKLFPAPAEPPPITMSAGLAKKFSWKPRCGLIKFRLLTAQNIHRSFKLLSGFRFLSSARKSCFLTAIGVPALGIFAALTGAFLRFPLCRLFSY